MLQCVLVQGAEIHANDCLYVDILNVKSPSSPTTRLDPILGQLTSGGKSTLQKTAVKLHIILDLHLEIYGSGNSGHFANYSSTRFCFIWQLTHRGKTWGTKFNSIFWSHCPHILPLTIELIRILYTRPKVVNNFQAFFYTRFLCRFCCRAIHRQLWLVNPASFWLLHLLPIYHKPLNYGGEHENNWSNI